MGNKLFDEGGVSLLAGTSFEILELTGIIVVAHRTTIHKNKNSWRDEPFVDRFHGHRSQGQELPLIARTPPVEEVNDREAALRLG